MQLLTASEARAIGQKCEGAEVVSWDVVFAKQALKDAKKSETLQEPTRAASTSSIDWFTKYSPKRGPSVYCVCGPTMSELANRSAHAQWHNPVAVDEATARFRLTVSPAWVAARNVAMGASDIGMQYHEAYKIWL